MPRLLPRRLPERLALLAGIVAVGIAWWLVIQQLRSVEPVATHVRAAGIVWNDRVFTSRVELAKWLGRHGVDYSRWSAKHPGALRIVDRTAYRKQLRTQGNPEFSAARQPRDDHSASSSSGSGGVPLPPLPGFSLLLVVLATILWTLAALPYRSLSRRFQLPELLLAAGEYRIYLVAAAAAVSLGVATGIGL